MSKIITNEDPILGHLKDTIECGKIVSGILMEESPNESTTSSIRTQLQELVNVLSTFDEYVKTVATASNVHDIVLIERDSLQQQLKDSGTFETFSTKLTG